MTKQAAVTFRHRDLVRHRERGLCQILMVSKGDKKTRLHRAPLLLIPADGTAAFWANREHVETVASGREAREKFDQVRQAAVTAGKDGSEAKPKITNENFKSFPWWQLRDHGLYAKGDDASNTDGKRWTFFRASRYFALVLKPRDARMLDFLINWQQTYGKSKDWFFCYAEEIQEYAFIPKRAQEAIFTALREKKYIRTQMRGTPPYRKRYIWIDYHRIVGDIYKAAGAWRKKYPYKAPDKRSGS